MLLCYLDGGRYLCQKRGRGQKLATALQCHQDLSNWHKIRLEFLPYLVCYWHFIIYKTKTYGFYLIWRLRWPFESFLHALHASSRFKNVTKELLLKTGHPILYLFFARMFVFNLIHWQPELHLWCQSVITAFRGCYCCLSVSRRDTTVCWQRQKTDYRFCQHAAVKEKVKWWMLGCLAKRPTTITSFAGRVLSLVLGSVHQLTKPWCAMSVFELQNVWELWRPKIEKKNATAKLLLFKKKDWNPI